MSELSRRVFDAVRGDARRYGEFCRADSDRERVRLAWESVDSGAEQLLQRTPGAYPEHNLNHYFTEFRRKK